MAFKIVNTPELLKGLVTPPSLTPLSAKGSSIVANLFSSAEIQSLRSSQPEKAKGVIGTRGPSSPIAPNALSLEQINSLTKSSGATTELRKRAVKIAYSYIGADELPGNNIGWWDSIFQTKMEKLPKAWKPSYAWCNAFTNLVWIEAFSTGNALVGASSNGEWAKTLKDVFNNGKSNRKGVVPKDKYIDLSLGTANTYKSFRDQYRGEYFISKNDAKTGKKLPQPGDMIRYNGSHIEILTKVYIKKGKMTHFDSVSGNSSAKDPRDGGGLVQRKNISINTSIVKGITGFLVLSDTYS